MHKEYDKASDYTQRLLIAPSIHLCWALTSKLINSCLFHKVLLYNAYKKSFLFQAHLPFMYLESFSYSRGR